MTANEYLACLSVSVGGAGLFLAGLAMLLRGRRLLAAAQKSQADSERTLLAAGAAEDHIDEQLALAIGARDEALRIEELLVRPRWALNVKSGRIHALLHGEEPDLAVEVEAGEPDRDCKDCGGRGWRGRDTATQRVIPCACTKRQLHRARLAAKG